MNTINEVELLKALLPEPSKSMYSLKKELKEKLASQNVNVNYPTLRRHIRKLVADDFISTEKGKRKNGKVDRRQTKNLYLTFKGLVYLILKADLKKHESRLIARRVFQKPIFQRIKLAELISVHEIPVSSLEKTFRQIRSRVNIEFFDEEYVKTLLFETLIIENELDEVIKWKKQHLDSPLSKIEPRKLRKMAKRDAKKFPAEWIQLLFEIYDYLRMKQASWNEKITLLKPVVKYFRRTLKP